MNARTKYNELVARAQKHAENLRSSVPSTITGLAGKAMTAIIAFEACPENDENSRLALAGRCDTRLNALDTAVTKFEGKTRKFNEVNRVTSELWDFSKMGQKATTYADKVALMAHYRQQAEERIAELQRELASLESSVPDEQLHEFTALYKKILQGSGVTA